MSRNNGFHAFASEFIDKKYKIKSRDDQSDTYYVLDQVIGKGLFGVVFKGSICSESEPVDSSRQRAIKIIRRDQMNNQEYALTESEARIISEIGINPNILYCFEHFSQTISGTNYYIIVTEFCQNGDLMTYLKKCREYGRQVPAHYQINWSWQMVSVAKFLSDANIIHRDIKPSNLLISDTFNDKDVINLKLGDFGFARQLDQSSQQAWTKLGTALYAAPEIEDDRGYDYKADIWSIGCIVYEVCTVKYAFWDGRSGYDALEIRKNLKTLPIPTLDKNHRMARILSRMLVRDPNLRSSAGELLLRMAEQNLY